MKTVLFVLSLAATCASSVFAQTTATATLRVTVLDPSNAIIVGATVTVTGAEPATSAQSVPEAKSAETGIATFTGLAPGRYTIQADFPGFETRTAYRRSGFAAARTGRWRSCRSRSSKRR